MVLYMEIYLQIWFQDRKDYIHLLCVTDVKFHRGVSILPIGNLNTFRAHHGGSWEFPYVIS